jgi:tyrosyl-tRNA synthetase
MVEQGAVRLDGEVEKDLNLECELSPGGEGLLIQVGKRKFARVRRGS